MPIISFSVFKDKIQNGSKRQTIRKLRVYPIKKNDKLFLWWKSRTPNRAKIGETICSEEFKIRMSVDVETDTPTIPHLSRFSLTIFKLSPLATELMNPVEKEELAVLDGFDSSASMAKWFWENHGWVHEEVFQVIRWDELTVGGK
jgi:hypothetical protein